MGTNTQAWTTMLMRRALLHLMCSKNHQRMYRKKINVCGRAGGNFCMGYSRLIIRCLVAITTGKIGTILCLRTGHKLNCCFLVLETLPVLPVVKMIHPKFPNNLTNLGADKKTTIHGKHFVGFSGVAGGRGQTAGGQIREIIARDRPRDHR